MLLAARDMGARGALSVHTVHGWGTRERLGAWGVAVETEKDVIVFLVSSDQQDLIFEAVYQAADMNAPGRGFMFISPVERVATYVPEAVRKQLGVNSGMSALRTDSAPRVSDFPAGKVIYCVLPDDGTDKRVLVELRKKHGIVRAGSDDHVVVIGASPRSKRNAASCRGRITWSNGYT